MKRLDAIKSACIKTIGTSAQQIAQQRS